jgi:threonyl-tRNA synthetase
VGDKEMESGEISVRARHGQDLGSLTQQAFIETLGEEVSRKGLAESA